MDTLILSSNKEQAVLGLPNWIVTHVPFEADQPDPKSPSTLSSQPYGPSSPTTIFHPT
ncbi:MAG: hypothetical protein ABEK50_05220 [bacterium]